MSLPAPTDDSLLAKVARATAPGWGCCGRCGLPWKYVKGHTVNYTVSSGCFPICDACWDLLTPETRLPYYEAWAYRWDVTEAIEPLRLAILGQPAPTDAAP